VATSPPWRPSGRRGGRHHLPCWHDPAPAPDRRRRPPRGCGRRRRPRTRTHAHHL